MKSLGPEWTQQQLVDVSAAAASLTGRWRVDVDCWASLTDVEEVVDSDMAGGVPNMWK